MTGPERDLRDRRYEILEAIGSGGMGEVFRARDLVRGVVVALKLSHAGVSDEALRDEFRALSRLRHPGVARALDFGRLGERPFLALEYIEGESLLALQSRLRDSIDGRARLLAILARLADAIGYLHHRGLLHLDLKPENVLVVGDQPKLVDFGLARHRIERTPAPDRCSARFAAPEIFLGGDVGPETDLYALGVTIHHALTGKYPISGRSVEELRARHLQGTPRIATALSSALRRTLSRLLARAPEHRFGEAGEVARRLRDAALETPCAPETALLPGNFDTPELTSRETELDAFFDWLQTRRRGEGPPVLWFTGEPGLGKTRLLEALANELKILDVATVECGSEQTELAARLSRAVRSAQGLRTTMPLDAPHRGEWLRKAGAGRVLIVDSVRASDEALLLSLVRESATGERPAGWIVSSRHDGDQAATDPRVRRVPLTRLSPAALVDSVLRIEPTGDRAALLRAAENAGGNPGAFVLLATRALARADAHLQSVEAATEESFLSLRETSRRLVTRLAVLGRAASDPLLRTWLREIDPELDAAARRDVEHEIRTSPLVRSDLANARLVPGYCAEVILRRLEFAERAREHAAVARSLEELRSKALDDETRSTARESGANLAAEAAEHWLRSDRPERALESIATGVRGLVEDGENERLSALCRDALALFADDASHPAQEDASRRALRDELEETLCASLERLGHFDEALGRWQKLVDLEASVPTRCHRLRRLGSLEQRRGDSASAGRWLERALATSREADHATESARTLRELAHLQILQGAYGDAKRSVTEALELLDSLDTSTAQDATDSATDIGADLEATRGQLQLRELDFSGAAEAFERALAALGSSGDPARVAVVLNNLGVALHQSNQLERALEIYAHADRLAREREERSARGSIRCNQATIEARRGRIGAARSLLDEAAGFLDVPPPARAALLLEHSRGLVERLAGSDTTPIWRRVIALAEQNHDTLFGAHARVFLYENEILRGRWAAARALETELSAVVSTVPSARGPFECRKARLDALCGDHVEARRLAAAQLALGSAAPETMSGKMDSSTPAGRLWDLLFAAAALGESGEQRAAAELLERIAAVFAATDQGPGELECRLLRAELALDAGLAAEAGIELDLAAQVQLPPDVSPGSIRDRAFRVPYLRARAWHFGGPQSARSSDARRGLIVEALGALSLGSSAESRWKIADLARRSGFEDLAAGGDEARVELLAGLPPADLARIEDLSRTDTTLRVAGASTPNNQEPNMETQRFALRWLDAIESVRSAEDLATALEELLLATGAARVSFFRDQAERHADIEIGAPSSSRSTRRETALRVRSQNGEAVLLREVHARDGAGGVLACELVHLDAVRVVGRFLDLAVHAIEDLIANVARSGSSSRQHDTTRRAGQVTETRELGSLHEHVLTESPRFRKALGSLDRVVDSDLPILLVGPSGSGKDHVARWVHARGERSGHRFVAFDCSAVPEGLLEAELFGHEEGAFTGADSGRAGWIEEAEGGTLYLDHVDSTSLAAQATLLRLIESRRYRRLGGRTEIEANVRVIAASQRPLAELMAGVSFRRDLYFRLAGVTIELPPLSERPEDVQPLFEHLLRKAGGSVEVAERAWDALREHAWPGNVRELESLVRRLVVTGSQVVDEAHVRRALGIEDARPTPETAACALSPAILDELSYEDAVRVVKRAYLERLYLRLDGDIDRVARTLQTTRRNVYYRFTQLGICPAELREQT